MDVLREEWDENTLSWKPCGQGSMTKIGPVTDDCGALTDVCDASVYDKLDEMFGEVMAQVHACCAPKTNVKHLEA